MKTTLVLAAVAATLTLAGNALAQTPDQSTGGHWEWHAPRQVGPRAPVQAPQRVRVPDEVANTDYPIMRGPHAADCRAMMDNKAT